MIFLVNNNAQLKTGDHIIHQGNCNRCPEEKNTTILGDFTNEKVALAEAHKHYSCVNGCKYCCKKIHLNHKKGDK